MDNPMSDRVTDKYEERVKFKDSGNRQTFATGANRDVQKGKGRFDLMPPFVALFVSRIYEVGCEKYGDRNWEKGIPISRFLDSAKRHIEKYQAGLRDEPHLSMATWNLSCALWTAAMVTLGLRPAELDDLVSHVSAEKPPALSAFELASLSTFLGQTVQAVPKDQRYPMAGVEGSDL